jgi:hypothetical protein
MNKDEIYTKWYDIGLLEGFPKEEAYELAQYFEEALELVKEVDDEESYDVTTFFPILRRLFQKNKKINVREIYDTLVKYYQTIEYKGLKAELLEHSYFAIDVESELTNIISENYETIRKDTRSI